jgi:hypothetical protein
VVVVVQASLLVQKQVVVEGRQCFQELLGRPRWPATLRHPRPKTIRPVLLKDPWAFSKPYEMVDHTKYEYLSVKNIELESSEGGSS